MEKLCLAVAVAGLAVASQSLHADPPLVPNIYSQPLSRTVRPGIAVTFKVDAEGYPPLSYRWRKNGAVLPTNYNANILTVAGSITNSDSWDIVITNGFGSITSAVAVLTVTTQAVSISLEPTGGVACSGATVYLNAQAGGQAPVRYQWQVNGTDVPGAGASSLPSSNYVQLVLPSVTAGTSGGYTLVVSNSFGSLTSAVARLDVDPVNPIIRQQPQGQLVPLGGSATLRVSAGACSSLSYQWHSNGVELAGATGASLVFSNATADLTAFYDVTVMGASGSTPSRQVWLVATNSPPVLNCQPISRTVSAGSNATFSVCASGQPPLVYLWRHDGNPVSPQTNSSSHTVRYALPADAGGYDVVVTNLSGSVTSAVATLTVVTTSPTIVSNPVNASVAVGETAYFNVRASGAPPPAYQWRKGTSDLPGKTNSLLVLTNVAFDDAGSYSVLAYSIAGSAPSTEATLTVLAGTPPEILIQPSDQTLSLSFGSNAFFSVYAVGSEPLTYQWFHNSNVASNGTENSLMVIPMSPADAGEYFVVVSNIAGVVTSAVARLTLVSFFVSIDPVSDYIAGGAVEYGAPREIYFQGYAYAPGLSAYQWFHNDESIVDATNESLYLGPMTTNDTGNYYLVASNVFGVSTSAVETIWVLVDRPYIYSPPMGQTLEPGLPYGGYIGVGASGALPLDFYWFHNGAPVPGTPVNAFDNLCSFGPVTTNDAGDYFVIVSNFVGTATSAVVRINVEYTPPSIYSQPQNASAYVGNFVSLCVGAIGSPVMTYQWQHEGTNIFTSTNNNCFGFNAATNSAGEYRVIVSNGGGSMTSAVARVTVLRDLPRFLLEPVDQDAGVGAAVTLYGSSTNGYGWWQFNGQPLPDQSLIFGSPQPLILDDLRTNQAGQYALVLSNYEGMVTSRVVTLTVPNGPLDHWHWRNPLPQGNDLYDAVYGHGRIVAVGLRGAKVLSLDGGESWEAHNQSRGDLLHVAYGNGVFVGVSSDRIQTSLDGIHWQDRDPGVIDFHFAQGIAFGNDRFVAIGSYGGVIVSSNGVDWVKGLWPNVWSPVRIAFGHGKFLIADSGGSSVSYATSSDGVNWTNSILESPTYVLDLTYGDGQFSIWGYNWAGSARYRLNTWPDEGAWLVREVNTTNVIYHLALGNGKLVGSDYSGHLASSSDGINWQDQSAVTNNGWFAVTFCHDRFVSLGNYGNLATSFDGQSWDWISSAGTINLRCITRGHGRYVAAGNAGTLFTSTDGESWAKLTLPTTANLRGVTHGAGLFVAVGEPDATGGLIFTSSDGLAWTRQTLGAGYDLYSVAYGAGVFVAVGENGSITSSTNGVDWVGQYSTTSRRLNSITYGGGRFVAVGKKGTIATSTNGTYITSPTNGSSWSSSSYAGLLTSASQFLQGIAYGNGVYVAAGEGGGLLVSSNAVDWSAPPSPFMTPYSISVEDVQFANGVFIAVGSYGAIATSPDGRLWTWRYSGCGNDLRGAYYSEGRFYVVGNNETILASDFNGPPLLHVSMPHAQDTLQINVSSEPGTRYRLQVSSNLSDWTDVLTFTNTTGVAPWQDTNGMLHPQRFYRVISP